jgi:hypothetical protein
MKIQSINNNYNSGFGANIKFMNPHHLETMPNINDTARAKSILGKISEKSPGTDILITYTKTYLPENSFLEATNKKTGVTIRERISKNDYDKDFNKLPCFGGCETFYTLLETILNPNYMIHEDFWGHEKKFKPSLNPNQHSVFVA